MFRRKLTVKTFIESFFKIKTKDGRLAEFKLNEAQRRFYSTLKEDYGKKPCRYIVLKTRQFGMSTFTEAVITCLTITHKHSNALIVAQDSVAAGNIYDMTKRYINNLPDALKPGQKYSNAKELVFDREQGGLDSSIRVMSAQNEEGARSSTFRYVHLSELAFWNHPETAMTAIMQTVPSDPETLVVVESTANGYNYFHDLWERAERGENDFTPLFFPWYLDKTYKRKYSGFVPTPYEKEIQERFGLSLEQLEWRRWCIANNCGGSEITFRQEYPITPEEAFILSGQSVFDTEAILARLRNVPAPIRQGCFEYDYDGLRISNIRWKEDKNGIIKIYQDPDGKYTVLGGDTAGEGSDYFSGHVLDKEGRQLAVLHHQTDEDLYARQMYCLGMHYKSVMAIEVNFSSFPIKELQRLNYPWMYVRKNYDVMLESNQARYGFRTTSLTRPVIIANLVEIVRTAAGLINDEDTLREMLTFVKINGKPQAAEGAHDDLVMGLAIAYECRDQIPVERKRVTNTDMDDFISWGG